MSKLYAEKLARCIAGLAFFGFGITLFIRANLGLAPWDIFHKGLSEKLDVSIGLVIVGVGLLLLLLWIPLRQKPGVGTVLNALEIGFVVNLTKPLIGEPDQLVMRTFINAKKQRSTVNRSQDGLISNARTRVRHETGRRCESALHHGNPCCKCWILFVRRVRAADVVL